MAVHSRVDDFQLPAWLTACTPGSAPGPMLSNEYGKPSAFTFTFYSDLELARSIPVRYTVTQR